MILLYQLHSSSNGFSIFIKESQQKIMASDKSSMTYRLRNGRELPSFPKTSTALYVESCGQVSSITLRRSPLLFMRLCFLAFVGVIEGLLACQMPAKVAYFRALNKPSAANQVLLCSKGTDLLHDAELLGCSLGPKQGMPSKAIASFTPN